MNKSLACLACVVALTPAIAAAKSGYFDSDTLTFAAGSTPMTVTFQWSDAVFAKTSGQLNDMDGKYRWVLTDLTAGTKFKESAIPDSITGDKNNVFSGDFTHTFDNLVQGHDYKLKFVGKWSEPEGHKWNLIQNGDVALAVPEPETYAMLLAGLGMVGAMARRRNAARRQA